MRRAGNARYPTVDTPQPSGRVQRTVAGNERVTTAVVHVPDAWSVSMAASMAIATNTASPMSVGVNCRFAGDPGYGVNRWGGRTANPQAYVGAAVYPVLRPQTSRVGSGYGAVDGGAYPNTGPGDAASIRALAAMGPGGLLRGMG